MTALGTHGFRFSAIAVVLALIVASSVFTAILPLPEVEATNGVTKDMTFLLHHVNDTETAKPLPGGGSTLTYFDTTLEFNSVNASIKVEGTQKVLKWFLVPALAGSFTAEGFTLRIWANSSTTASSNAQVTLEIFELDASASSTLVHQINLGSQTFPVTHELKTWSSTFAGPYIFRTGSSIELRMTVNPGALQGVFFHHDTARFNSRVSFRGPDSLDIAGIATLDSGRNPTSSFDPTASNKTMYVQALARDPLGGYDIKYVNFTIYDPFGTVLVRNESMAKVSGTVVSFESLYEFKWNYSLQPVGIYRVVIWALDNNGHNWYFFFAQFTYADYSVTREGTFSIGQIFYVNIHVLDNASTPLANARVDATQLGRTIASASTNASGWTSMTLGSSEYDFVVVWQGVPAGTLRASVNGNITLTIMASVYYPVIRVVDSRSTPLSGAAVTYIHPNGTTSATPLLTGENGEVVLSQTAGGFYSVSVRWRGTEVAQATVNVNSSLVLVIPVSVYYVDFHVIDSRGANVEFASIVVRDTTNGLVLDSQLADALGRATSRLPVGTVQVDVFLQNILVGTVTGFNVDSDKSVTVNATNLTYLTVRVLDREGRPLSGVIVGVEPQSVALRDLRELTPETGTVEFRIPAGDYRVVARLITTYQLSPIDMTVSQQVTLAGGDQEVTLQITEFAPPIYATNTFLFSVLLAVVVAGLGAYVFFLRRGHARPSAPTIAPSP